MSFLKLLKYSTLYTSYSRGIHSGFEDNPDYTNLSLKYPEHSTVQNQHDDNGHHIGDGEQENSNSASCDRVRPHTQRNTDGTNDVCGMVGDDKGKGQSGQPTEYHR